MTGDMKSVSNTIKAFLLANYHSDECLVIKDLTHMVFIAYYDKKGDEKNINQFPYHRDQRYSRNGVFMTTMNSQERHTATCILTIDDSRTLYFQCFQDNGRKDKKGSIKIAGREHASKKSN